MLAAMYAPADPARIPTDARRLASRSTSRRISDAVAADRAIRVPV
jgi:hypothetical protein